MSVLLTLGTRYFYTVEAVLFIVECVTVFLDSMHWMLVVPLQL
jgi:hypothetical protein